MTSPGDLFADRYRLERLLARGGMGSVWVARDERLSRTVAIKFMDPNLASSEELKARFKREASAAGALRTRHVVQVHDFGVEDDTPYIVMELLEGEDLGARLSRLRRLSLAEAVPLVTQIARGLRHAHEGGIIHRDLKPQNLFVCKEDDEGEVVKILDFGVAKRTMGMGGVLGDATTTKELLGSPQYMSPEQTRGRGDIDHRSDLWALGVICYRMVTGRIPFDSENMIDLIVRIQSEAHPLASSIDPELVPFDAFFAKAMAKDPQYRFGSAPEMAAAFGALAGRTDSLRPSLFGATPAPPQSLSGQMVPPALQSVPAMPTSGATPAPTPAPRSGANPAPSVFGVSPPSYVPGKVQRFPTALVVAVAAMGTTAVAAVLMVTAMPGPGDTAPPRAATSPPTAIDAPVTSADPPAEPPSAAIDPPATPPTSVVTASPAPSTAPSASAPTVGSAPAKPVASAKPPAPKGSGEKKLLLTY